MTENQKNKLRIIIIPIITAMSLIYVVSAVSGNDNTPKTKVSQVSSEEKICMDRYRWDTTAVNTSRMAVQLHFHNKGQGELAKYVSDYDAVKLVYCSGK